ncbi:ferritin-like domain-containing protein [Moorella sulfitireducens (nom. illeg.)]|uniref:ferritin-like domain-containing protein n=1 Tax=Neomoorella sulfitireducens TaxID=2972948 RepID=UPI0021AC543F|nr:ferritin-like domain-containing protein [Moorella sulfitireducens]
MTIEQVIKLLNLDLSWEYAAMIQYIQHASMLTGPQYFAIIDEELQHAQDEHDHAVKRQDPVHGRHPYRPGAGNQDFPQ